jgi:hypothetical protein
MNVCLFEDYNGREYLTKEYVNDEFERYVAPEGEKYESS